jgi:hypothetical protein
MSVDQLPPSGVKNAPQGWNRYSYGHGDPAGLGDPSGRIACNIDGGDVPCSLIDSEDFVGGGTAGGSWDPVLLMMWSIFQNLIGAANANAPSTLSPLFIVRIPTSLQVVNVSVTPCTQIPAAVGANPPETFGIRIKITYQVLDQFGLPLDVPGLSPMENIANASSTNPPPPTFNSPFVTKPGFYVALRPPTGVNGQFSDTVGYCDNAPETITLTQSLILGPSFGPPVLVFNGNPILVNNWTDVVTGPGTGTISNGAGVSGSTP